MEVSAAASREAGASDRALALLCLAAALLAPAGSRADEPDAGSASPSSAARGLSLGDALPHFLLPTLNAALCGLDVLSTRRLVGTQAAPPRPALVVSFAASYCKPCRRELPELARRAAEFGPRGVAFVVVLLDTEEEGRAEMRRFTVDELGLPFPVVADRFGLLGQRYGAGELPLLVVSDARGSVRSVTTGYREDTLPRLDELLEELLAEPPPGAPAPPPPVGGPGGGP